ncbi:ABC transporter family substrate-binding protein [Nonomuraea sp. NPDC050663]|uniref:ABC transporter family substrate-binding protein n=1 Tax=Nonomuraea sp. NPDC050663 TaxID=3364370 RepID=UPI003788AAD7
MDLRKARSVALTAVALLALSACAGQQTATPTRQASDKPEAVSEGFANCPSDPANCNKGERKQGGQIVYALEQGWNNWNINDGGGNLLYTAQALAPVNTGVFFANAKPEMTLNTDLMQSAELTDPTTIVYKIRPEAVWNDGTPISGKDFEFVWKIANGKDCDPAKCRPWTQSGYDQITSLEVGSDGKTVTAKLAKPFADWKGLFIAPRLFPSHVAEKAVGALDNEANLAKAVDFFGKTQPTWSAGPYKLESYKQGDSLVFVPNDKWFGAEKPSLERLIFKIITDVPQLPTALANREVNAIYPQPQVDMIKQLQADTNSNHYVGPGLGWEHFDINTSNTFLKDKALRQAIFTAVDRQALIDKTVGQFAPGITPLNNYNLFEGVSPHYKDVITATGAGQGKIDEAKKILTDAGYKIEGENLITPDGKPVPEFRTRYTNGNAVRKTMVEALAEQVRPLGVKIRVQPTDDLSGTLIGGDFDIIIFGWTGTLQTFSSAQQNWGSKSASNFSKYGTADIDKLLAEAATTPDEASASATLNQALEQFAQGYAVLPLYLKPTTIAVNKDVVNVRNNPTGQAPVYNTQEWGLLAQ